MARKQVPVAAAKARLSQWIRLAEDGEVVVITRHGKPVAALVRTLELQQLERLRAAGPEGGLASLAGGWEDSDELVCLVESDDRSEAREVPPID